MYVPPPMLLVSVIHYGDLIWEHLPNPTKWLGDVKLGSSHQASVYVELGSLATTGKVALLKCLSALLRSHPSIPDH